MRTVAVAVITALAAVGAPLLPAMACPGPDEMAVIAGEPLSDLDDLVGRTVVGADGSVVGTVSDVTLDDCRTPDAIVVDEAGSGRPVAIPTERIEAVVGDDALRLSGLTVASVRTLPTYDAAVSATALNRGGKEH